MYKILIVEDDSVIAELLKAHLQKWGYEIKCAERFDDITAEVADFAPHLVLMDIYLPCYNGYYWCQQIRKVSSVPIIFISSASDNMNVVMAINMGGDDFIAKPFDPDVAAAKVQALLRRTYSFSQSASLLEHGGAVLNLCDASLTFKDEKVELTKNEFKILQLLMENKGRAVSRSDLMKRLWESDCFIDDNTLTVNVTRLRKKLDEVGLEGFIATRKGMGYLVGG